MDLFGVDLFRINLSHTNIEEFDDREFLEEIVDAFNYFFSLVILAGYDADDLYRAYVAKDKIIHNRLYNRY